MITAQNEAAARSGSTGGIRPAFAMSRIIEARLFWWNLDPATPVR